MALDRGNEAQNPLWTFVRRNKNNIVHATNVGPVCATQRQTGNARNEYKLVDHARNLPADCPGLAPLGLFVYWPLVYQRRFLDFLALGVGRLADGDGLFLGAASC